MKTLKLCPIEALNWTLNCENAEVMSDRNVQSDMKSQKAQNYVQLRALVVIIYLGIIDVPK